MSGHGYPPTVPQHQPRATYQGYPVNQQQQPDPRRQQPHQPQHYEYYQGQPQQNQQPTLPQGQFDGYYPPYQGQGQPQHGPPSTGIPYNSVQSPSTYPDQFAYYPPNPQPQPQIQPQYQQTPYPSYSPQSFASPVQFSQSPQPVQLQQQQFISPSPAAPPEPPLQHPVPQPALATLDPALLQQASEPTKTIPPIKLRIKQPQPDPERAGMSSRARSSTTVKVEESYSSSGRPVRGARAAAEKKLTYKEDSDSGADAPFEEEEEDEAEPVEYEQPSTTRRSSRNTAGKAPVKYDEDDFEETMPQTSPLLREDLGRRSSGRVKQVRVDPDDSDEEPIQPRRKAFPPRPTRNSLQMETNGDAPAPERSTRTRGKRRDSSDQDFAPPPEPESTEEEESDDPLQLGSPTEDDNDSYSEDYGRTRRPRRKAQPKPTRRSTRNSNRLQSASDDEYGKPKRQLRERTSKVNYELPPLDISAELMQDAINNVAGPSRRRGVGFANGTRFNGGASKGLPSWMRGSLPQAMGDMDSSDSDMDLMAAPGGVSAPAAIGAAPGVRAGPTEVPNHGRINPKSNLADADPLGVNMNVTFDNVGGLDNHINQLKEMVALPLLYPELFQKFGLTPPRGVLFHGPPGTGKTLLARALAASCSTGNTKIAFFMRKGADVLSKWVGEAERQLRMLFEEARAAQPSIIFFDEIDGLAPVRSSKQDQIHASLVSTLLALMDGMDGRGQVIVIGATNRPDAVDSALRRPGRFDREFYFPLPNREARRKIIQINTRDWSPALPDPLLDQLSVMTKGYGGADLRALCTEAALNAIQRRYPQIYKTTDRLLLDHGSINVGAKDFMMSIQKITPSSARSTASAASQLPPHLVPLLSAPLDRLKSAVDRVLPRHKPATALDEAEFVDDIGDDLEKHMMVQSLDKLRTFRPRVLVHGPPGMGQTYLGPAILHHLEGFHIQSLDVGNLMADSTRTPEATLVQLFVEAKRHQPSILFIPSLVSWSYALSESARTTFRSLLDGIPSSDPVLLLAIADEPVKALPRDIRAWFGATKESRVVLTRPSAAERSEYFASLLEAFRRPPSDFPNALPRQKRVLEILPPAPPLPPRQPTEAELAREYEQDQNARNMMILSFTSLVQEFLKKFRKVVAGVREDAFLVSEMLAHQAAAEAAAAAAPVPVTDTVPLDGAIPNGHAIPTATPAQSALDAAPSAPIANGDDTDAIPTEAAVEVPAASDAVPPTVAPTWQAHDIDVDVVHRKLLRNKYYTPDDFLADIAKIEDNAAHIQDADRQARVAEMAANARLHVSNFDPKWTPRFAEYKERMRLRREKRDREKAKAQEGDADKVAEQDNLESDSSPAEGADGGLKRVREDGDVDTDDRQGKRLREDAMEVDAPESAPALASSTNSASTTAASAVPTIPIPVAGTDSTPASAITVPEPRPATQVPLPAYPPFIVPQDLFSSFESLLKDRTGSLSVDELEQLRAGCFDRLWRHRGQWDRTGVVQECLEWGKEYLKEVEEHRLEGEDED